MFHFIFAFFIFLKFMNKQIYKNNFSVSYHDIGSKNKPTVVLIHGFLETSEIWDGFRELLAKKFRVISVDLPGHGKSELYSEPFSMCKYAESVKFIIDFEKISSVFLIGHSMGGYVAMAFAEKYMNKLSALSLFHSVPYNDTDEKKAKRNEMLEKIAKGYKNELITNHFHSVYYEANIGKFKKEIQDGIYNAMQMTDENIKASILTMRDRNDRAEILKRLRVPFLYIIGKKDNFIPFSTLDEIAMPEKSSVLVLENTGHMGMTEEGKKSVEFIIDFYENFMNVKL